MTTVIGVHGAGCYAGSHPDEAVVAARSAEWTEALAAGLGRTPSTLDLRYVYYAPVLRQGRPAAQSGDPDIALDHLDAVSTELAAQWIDALDLPEATPQGRLTAPLRHLAQVVATKFDLDGKATKRFVATFFPDVAAYVAGPDDSIRQQVRTQVADAIADSGARVVIAHSLGTVVAYEALHARPDLEIDLLLTLGSPLALPHAVFHRLDPAPVDGVGRKPPNVRRWVSIADAGDPITILRPLRKYFPDVDLDPPSESISLFDFHRAVRYLRCAATATTIDPYL